MPKILLFAPSQKAILDKIDNTLSLISVLHGLTVNIQPETPGAPVPEKAVIQYNWSIATLWLRTAEDGDKTFEQRVDIISPKNEIIPANKQPFQMTQRTHQIVMLSNVFPVGVPGEYRLVLMLREVVTGSDEDNWQAVAEYSMEIKYGDNTQPKTGD